jgi:hypothetical protein
MLQAKNETFDSFKNRVGPRVRKLKKSDEARRQKILG